MKLIFKCAVILLLIARCGNLHCQVPAAAKAMAGRQGQALIDSLLKELPRQKEDTNKVKVFNNISFEYRNSNPDEGIQYGQQGLELAMKLQWKKGIAAANSNIGSSYLSKVDYPKALAYYNEALKIYKELEYKKGIGAVLGNIGLVYDNQSDYPKASEYYQNALKMYEEIGDKQNIARAAQNIGMFYFNLNDYPKALEYDFKALKIYEEIPDKKGLTNVADAIGVVYRYQCDYPKALEYYHRCLKMAEETGDKNEIMRMTENIGVVYDFQHDYPQALENHSKALKTAEELGNKFEITRITGNMAGTYQSLKNYTMAVECCQKALKMAEEIGNKYLAAGNFVAIGDIYISIVKDTVAETGKVIGVPELSVNKYEPTISIPTGKVALLAGAIDYTQRGLAIAKEIKSLYVLQDSYENLSEAYKLKGDYKKAMEYADNEKVIKDSVFSQENRDKIAKLENSRKEYGDSLRAVAAQRATDIQAQHRRNYEYIGALVIVLLLGFTFIVTRNNKMLDKEKKRSDNLLLNILPSEVAEELKDKGSAKAKYFDNVTVLFTDFVNFTSTSERMDPQSLIDELHACFKKFDEITGKYGIEKIKTIGDAYLAVAGLPSADPKHAEHIVQAAIEINAFMQDRVAKLGERTFQIRIGVHSGSVVAGIVGVKKFAYDIWGDTVNTAARMEQNSEAGRINISQTTYELVKDRFSCEYRGEIEAKGKGMMKMYYVV